MDRPEEDTLRPLSTPIILVLISAAHLSYVLLADLRTMPILLPAVAISVLLGGGYAVSAWLMRRDRGFELTVNLIVGEDLGFLAAGLLLGYPWADYLRPGTIIVIALQLAVAFAEIWRRQEAGRPIVSAARLAWFVIAYALAFALYATLKPKGLWSLAGSLG
ncbi:MAG: hypothetical protein JSV41_06600 [Gemmatimonadota bacterium]|nr:MAG: hypothetical protein JSV41_06600 [Gemmatimonadota bacterium]